MRWCKDPASIILKNSNLFWSIALILWTKITSGRVSRWLVGSLAALWFCLLGANAAAELTAVRSVLDRGFAPVPFVAPFNLSSFEIPAQEEKRTIAEFCQTLEKEFKRYHWSDNPCGDVAWHGDLKTRGGFPLIYGEFGKGPDVTIFFSAVHGDELTAVHLAFRLARQLNSHPELYAGPGHHVIVAPLVNPDGFLRGTPLRTNGTVDLNRNFITIDWYDGADSAWWQKYHGQPRYFPGYFPNTEVEILFQVNLIERFKGQKVFAVHAPLGFLDYDGPGEVKMQPPSQNDKRTRQYVYSIAKKAQNYRVVDYSYYPGSLGNFWGNERNGPTITLELETTLPGKVEQYWEKFWPAFVQSFQYPFEVVGLQSKENATQFFSSYYQIVRKEEGKSAGS